MTTTIKLTIERNGVPATFDVEIPQYIERNAERADMVRPFVQAFGWAYYGQDACGESDDTMIADLIADLLHLADRSQDEEGDPTSSSAVLDRASGHYEAELDEEESEVIGS